MAIIEELKKYLTYKGGALYWADQLETKRTTSRFGGALAGDLKNNGYWYVSVNKKRLLQHRVIFAIHHGWWPDEVDHIDGNPQNNMIENLRAATSEINGRNMKRRLDNKSGFSGLSKLSYGAWRIRIGAKHIGCYKTKEEAIIARSKHLKNNGYTDRHGEAVK